MKTIKLILVLTAVLLVSACADNSVSHDDGDEQLTARIEFSEDHLATLQEVEIDVFVAAADGRNVTNMASIMLQHRIHDALDWEAMDLVAHGDHFTADYRFMTSGDHEFRVLGSRHSGDAEQVLFEMDDHMEIERAHMEMSGMLISYEHEGGEVHKGDTIEMSFWIERMTGGDGHDGNAEMMTGLSPTIVCEEESGAIESHNASELENGGYGAQHTFASSGEAIMTVEFMNGGMMQRALFSLPVSDSH